MARRRKRRRDAYSMQEFREYANILGDYRSVIGMATVVAFFVWGAAAVLRMLNPTGFWHGLWNIVAIIGKIATVIGGIALVASFIAYGVIHIKGWKHISDRPRTPHRSLFSRSANDEFITIDLKALNMSDAEVERDANTAAYFGGRDEEDEEDDLFGSGGWW